MDARGFQRVGYPGSEATPERLAHDLALLEREAGEFSYRPSRI